MGTFCTEYCTVDTSLSLELLSLGVSWRCKNLRAVVWFAATQVKLSMTTDKPGMLLKTRDWDRRVCLR